MTTLSDVLAFIRNPSTSVDDRALIIRELNASRKVQQALAARTFRRGQFVTFTDRNGRIVHGVIGKVNRVNCNVTEIGNLRAWCVSPSLLKAV
jgi:hypothetical protein